MTNQQIQDQTQDEINLEQAHRQKLIDQAMRVGRMETYHKITMAITPRMNAAKVLMLIQKLYTEDFKDLPNAPK